MSSDSKIQAVAPIVPVEAPAIDFSKLTPEQIQQLFAQKIALDKAFAAEAKANLHKNANEIDALRYEIFDNRQSQKECAGCTAAENAAKAAHEELQKLVPMGMAKVKFSEEEITNYTARRSNLRKAAAKSAK
jgi:hypothetical protein